MMTAHITTTTTTTSSTATTTKTSWDLSPIRYCRNNELLFLFKGMLPSSSVMVIIVIISTYYCYYYCGMGWILVNLVRWDRLPRFTSIAQSILRRPSLISWSALTVINVARLNHNPPMATIQATTTTTTTKKPIILVMGLPKSGSLAIHHFFECNQWRSQHYCCDAGGTIDTGNTSTSTDSTERRTTFPCRHQTCAECLHRVWSHRNNELVLLRPGENAFQYCSQQPPMTIQQENGNGLPQKGSSDAFPPVQVYSSFDAETSDFSWFLPQHYALPFINEEWWTHHRQDDGDHGSTDTVWILNTRDTPERWVTNVMHWYSTTERLLDAFHFYPPLQQNKRRSGMGVASLPQDWTYEYAKRGLADAIQKQIDNRSEWERKRTFLRQVYENHVQKVEQWASRYSQRIIRFNVDSPQAGRILADAFQLNAECWTFDGVALDNDWKNFSLPF